MAAEFEVPIELMARLQHAAEDAGVSVQDVMNDTKGRFTDLLNRPSGLDPEQVKKATEAQLAFGEATRALQYAMLPLLEIFTPIVKQVAEFVKQNAGLVRIIALVAGGLLAFGAAAWAVGAAVGGVVAVVGGLISAGTTVAGVFAAIGWPVALLVAAVAGLGVAFFTLTETGRDAVDGLKTGLGELLTTAKTTWGGIVAAVGKGDLGLAAKIALAGVSVEWAKAVLWWTEKWNGFKGIFVDGWHDVVAGVKLMFWDLAAWITRTFSEVIGGMLDAARWTARQLGADDLAAKLDGFDASDANINRNRDLIKNGILDDRRRQQMESDAARAASAAIARGDLAAAINELGALVADANANAPDAEKFKGYQKLQSAFAGFDAIKGNFNASSARQQFGYGDSLAKQQTELQKRIAVGVEAIPDKIANAIMDQLKAR